MNELWLKFDDEYGMPQRVKIKEDYFTIGRSPENTLSLPIDKISRDHLIIERYDDDYVASDLNSSNGTMINQNPLKRPTTLKNGDRLDLGGGLDIEIELITDEDRKAKDSVSSDPEIGLESENQASLTENDASQVGELSVSARSATKPNAAPPPGGISISFFIIAPLIGLFVLLMLGGLLFALGGKKKEDPAHNDDFVYTSNSDDFDDDEPKNKKTKDHDKEDTPVTNSPGNQPNDSNGNTVAKTPDVVETTPTPKISTDNDKIERNSALFMRQIAMNDPKAFLTSKQIAILSGKINQFKGSSALADNFRSAKKAQSQITSMAASKNLKPEFLVMAALAKLGNQRGDVAVTAQGMLETLDNLSIVFSDNLAYDSILVIAAYDMGVAGQTQQMRDMITKTATQFSTETPQTIRNVWFLKEKGKITDAQFEFALRFLAIGTIAQNPKEFNVNSEAVVFN